MFLEVLHFFLIFDVLMCIDVLMPNDIFYRCGEDE